MPTMQQEFLLPPLPHSPLQIQQLLPEQDNAVVRRVWAGVCLAVHPQSSHRARAHGSPALRVRTVRHQVHPTFHPAGQLGGEDRCSDFSITIGSEYSWNQEQENQFWDCNPTKLE